MRATGRFVGNHQHAQFVNVEKFRRLGFRRAGHARQFLIEAEIILDRDRRERLRFALDLHAFLGLDRLVQAIAPAAAGHQAARVFIHDDDLVVLDDVLHVLLVKAVGLEQLRNGVDALGLGLEFRLQLGLRLQPLARRRFPGRRRSRAAPCVRSGSMKASGSFGLRKLRPFSVKSASWLFSSMAKSSSSFSRVKLHLLLVGVQLQFGLVHQPQILRIFQHLHQTFGRRLAES